MLTDGCWSPTRPSLFFTSRTDGWLEGWDIIENQRSPVMTHKVHQGAAHCVSPHPEGFLVCVGGDSGDLAMIQLSSSLVEVTKAEKVTVATMLDRETRREKILSTLKKEARLKSKAKSKMKMFMDSGMLKKVQVLVTAVNILVISVGGRGACPERYSQGGEQIFPTFKTTKR